MNGRDHENTKYFLYKPIFVRLRVFVPSWSWNA